jgi:hypothetical protein
VAGQNDPARLVRMRVNVMAAAIAALPALAFQPAGDCLAVRFGLFHNAAPFYAQIFTQKTVTVKKNTQIFAQKNGGCA